MLTESTATPADAGPAPSGDTGAHTRVTGPAAWDRRTLQKTAWHFDIPKPVVDELLALVEHNRRLPLPLAAQHMRRHALDASREFMDTQVRPAVCDGPGVVVLHRIPVEGMSADDARILYWNFASLLARPVAQKHNGALMYDVKDSGAKATPGSAVRPSVTNDFLEFHNDGAASNAPPEYVGLLMLHDAKAGGLSRVMSVGGIHNWLVDHHPRTLARLYRDFKFDRMQERDPSEPLCLTAPFFTRADDGKLLARCGPYQMKSAFSLGEIEMDDEAADAVAALDEAFEQESLMADFVLEPGQIQFVNNRTTVHSRTEFEDYDEPERRRHLLRIWLRDAGGRAHSGIA